MDPETIYSWEKIGGCYFTAILLGGLTGYVRYLKIKATQDLKDVEAHGQAFNVADLRSNEGAQNYFLNPENMDKKCLVSGMLLQDKESKAMEARKLKKRLGLVEKKQDQLMTGEAEMGLEWNDQFKMSLMLKQKTEDNVMLVDELAYAKGSKQAAIYVDEKTAHIDGFFNTKKKHKLTGIRNNDRIEKYEEIKYKVREGSSVTLLGLVNYDSKSDRFTMTELSYVLAGGMQAARARIMEYIDKLASLQNTGTFLFTIVFGLGAFLHYKKLSNRRKLAEQARVSSEVKLDGPAPEGSAECIICKDHIATVVFAPCNHMLACKSCTLKLQ